MNPDDLLRLEYYKDTGQTEQARLYEQYLRETGKIKAQGPSIAAPPIAAPDAAASAAAVVHNPTPGRETTGDLDRARDMGLGLAASAPQAIPGMEAAQAGIRSAVRGQPYSEALSDMREETDPIPLPLKLAVQAPAMFVMGRVPLSPAKAGALFGGASQALDADNVPLSERTARTAFGTGGGAILGKVLDAAGLAARAWKPGRQTAGAITQDLQREMEATDATNYGLAAREGTHAAANPTPASLTKVLAEPDIAPYVAEVRASRSLQGADDATVLRETYKLLSEREQLLRARALTSPDFKAGSELEARDIAAAKRKLVDEADAIMPSFRGATQAHAEGEGKIDAVGTGVDAAKRVMGSTPGGDAVPRESAERYAERLRGMSPENRRLAVKAALAEARKRIGFQPNAVSLGGALTTMAHSAKMPSFLRSAGDEMQASVDNLIRLLLAGGSARIR